MARRVADMRAGLLAVAGMHSRDPRQPAAWSSERADRRPVAHRRDRRSAGWRRPTRASPPPSAAPADALADAGHEVDEAAPATLRARPIELWAELLMADLRCAAPAARHGDGRRRPPFLDLAADQQPADRHRRRGRRCSPSATASLRDWAAFFDRVRRAADADVDAAGVRPRRRHGDGRRRGWRRCDTDAPGAAGQPARPAGRRRARSDSPTGCPSARSSPAAGSPTSLHLDAAQVDRGRARHRSRRSIP